MKKLLSLIFAISLTLSACGTAQTQIAAPAETSTPTLTPTETQIPITPLPTIPTFTPTFDVSTIVTVTPAEKAVCPAIKENISINLPDKTEYAPNTQELTEKYINPIHTYLQLGGDPHALVNYMKIRYGSKKDQAGYFGVYFEDLTNDGTDEVILERSELFLGVAAIFSCTKSSYEIILQQNQDSIEYKIYDDLNQNNIPEIVTFFYSCSGFGCLNLNILEWNGTSLEKIGEGIMDAPRYEEFTDINSDGIKELTLKGEGDIGLCCMDAIPVRLKTIIYSWNGKSYTKSYTTFAKPEYRFQAIQDGDRETLYGNYKNALIFYQTSISDKTLEWWTRERKDYEVKAFYDAYILSAPTLLPYPIYPIEDPAEYPSLAAYAYYRIMLLHLAQGEEAEAASTYQTLQETFGKDPYAVPYIEMATAFWESYQSTQRMYDGCAAAIQYAVEHPEILIPLGSDYHGWQSHMYEPADVCPFR